LLSQVKEASLEYVLCEFYQFDIFHVVTLMHLGSKLIVSNESSVVCLFDVM